MFRIFSFGPKGERVDFRATASAAAQLVAELDHESQNGVRIKNPGGRSFCAEHVERFLKHPYGVEVTVPDCIRCR
jgi:hypothetical protein